MEATFVTNVTPENVPEERFDRLAGFILGRFGQMSESDAISKLLTKIASKIKCELRSQSTYAYSIPCESCDIGGSLHFYLKTVKGSLHTTVYNKFARIDDEYTLQAQLLNSNAHENIWHLKGFDCYNNKVLHWDMDWHVMKKIMMLLGVLDECSAQLFARMFSALLIALPAYRRDGMLIEPMPSSFMSVSHI